MPEMDPLPSHHRTVSSPQPTRSRTRAAELGSQLPTLSSLTTDPLPDSSTSPVTRFYTGTNGNSSSIPASDVHLHERGHSPPTSSSSLHRQLTYSSLPPSPTNPDPDEDRSTFHHVGTSLSLRSLPGRREVERVETQLGSKDDRTGLGIATKKKADVRTEVACGGARSRGLKRGGGDENGIDTDNEEEGLSADEIDGDPEIVEERFELFASGEAGPSGWRSHNNPNQHPDEQTDYFPIHHRLDHLSPFVRVQDRTIPSSSTDPDLARHILGDDHDAADDNEERSLRAVSLPPDEDLEGLHDRIRTKGSSNEDRPIRAEDRRLAPGGTPHPEPSPMNSTMSRTPSRPIGIDHHTPRTRLAPPAAISMLRTQSGGAIGSTTSGGRPLRGRAHSHAHAHALPGRSSYRRDGGVPQVSTRHTYRETGKALSVDTFRPVTPLQETVEVEDDVDETLAEDGSGLVVPERKSIWGVLIDEMSLDEGDHQEGFSVDGKWDRIANFLAIPLAVEKNVWFGSMLCLDSFLFQFTILPIRAFFAIIAILVDWISARRFRTPPLAHLRSLLRMSLVVIPTGILLVTTDASRMYHLVRGQDTIKLYVIFGAVEVADKLCCAFGQDILDTLFARETLDPALWPSSSPTEDKFPESPGVAKARIRKRERARPVFFWLLAVGYIHVHSLVLFYQLVCLNVAINSYDNALLTLLVSNQFTEIKGSVFKKFEKDNLFQILCADIVERYQLGLMLGVIAVRNLIEMAGSDLAFLPKSFIRGKGALETILSPALVVIMSEMVTDWLKHAFITKFNHVRASVYERYTDVLCKDILLAGGSRQTPSLGNRRRRSLFVDQSPLVTRRLGLATLPLCCLVIRVGFQGLGMLIGENVQDPDTLLEIQYPVTSSSYVGEQALRWIGILLVLLIGWLLILAIKLLLGLNLLAYAAHREHGMNARERHDALNDYSRLPISENKAERTYAKEVSTYLSNAADTMPKPRPLAGHPKVALEDDREPGAGSKSTKPKTRLEDIERWTMVKRIF